MSVTNFNLLRSIENRNHYIASQVYNKKYPSNIFLDNLFHTKNKSSLYAFLETYNNYDSFNKIFGESLMCVINVNKDTNLSNSLEFYPILSEYILYMSNLDSIIKNVSMVPIQTAIIEECISDGIVLYEKVIKENIQRCSINPGPEAIIRSIFMMLNRFMYRGNNIDINDHLISIFNDIINSYTVRVNTFKLLTGFVSKKLDNVRYTVIIEKLKNILDEWIISDLAHICIEYIYPSISELPYIDVDI